MATQRLTNPHLYPDGWTPPEDEEMSAEAEAQFAKAMSESEDDLLIAVPLSDKVELPGGIYRPMSGDFVTELHVRELTGVDEERIARIDMKSTEMLMTTLVRLAVSDITIDDLTLDQMLIGDRDMILLGLRRVTYGNLIKQDEVSCPRCEEVIDIEIDLDKDVEIKKLASPELRTFEVELRGGHKARVRLATHGDMLSTKEKKHTIAEMNTLLLSRCVISIDNTALNDMAEDPLDTVRSLGSADRTLLIKTMSENQPGPLFGEVKVSCPECDFEAPFPIDLAELFRN